VGFFAVASSDGCWMGLWYVRLASWVYAFFVVCFVGVVVSWVGFGLGLFLGGAFYCNLTF